MFFLRKFRQEDEKPAAVTRSEQVQLKGDTTKGNKRRGGGGKKSDKVADEKANWHYEENFGWFWVGDQMGQEIAKGEKPKRKAKAKASPKKPAKAKASPKKLAKAKASPKGKVQKRPASKSGNNDDEENASKRRKTKQEGEGKTRKRKAAIEPIPGPPANKKEQRDEILNFLLSVKDVKDEDAKATLKAMLPNYGANGFDCSPDIYWVRKGVKGIGCGVRCQSEGKSVGFFAYRAQCNSWIFALAAAIKSADILVTHWH